MATCWKPSAAFADKARDDDSHVYITVERFVDCVKQFDLWETIREHPGFRDHVRWSRHYDDGEDDDDHDPDRSPQGLRETERMLDLFGIEGEPRTQWWRMHLIEFQNSLLASNRISKLDRPGGVPKRFAMIADLWKRQAHPLLFSLDLRGLPARGESKEFRAHVREQVRAKRERWGECSHFIVPVELDIQVPDQPGVKPTDLDNIVRSYIAPALTGELLREPHGYIHGYRVYRVRRAHDRTINVRIMPEGSIQRFSESVEKTLDAGHEWLADVLRAY